jgi:hypothetical protein
MAFSYKRNSDRLFTNFSDSYDTDITTTRSIAFTSTFRNLLQVSNATKGRNLRKQRFRSRATVSTDNSSTDPPLDTLNYNVTEHRPLSVINNGNLLPAKVETVTADERIRIGTYPAAVWRSIP